MVKKSILNTMLSIKYLDRYGLLVLLGLVFGLQIVMLIPLSIRVSTTPFSIAFRATLLGVSMILLFRNIIVLDQLKINKGIFFLIGFLFIYLIRLFYDLSIAQVPLSPRLKGSGFIYTYYIGSTIIPVLALAGLLRRIDISFIEKSIFWISLAQALSIGIIFFMMFNINIDAFFSRYLIATAMAESDIGQPINPIVISKSGGILAILAILYKNKNFWGLSIKLFAFVFGLGLLFLGSSRGPLVSFVFTLLFVFGTYVFYEKKNVKWLLKVFSILTLLVIGISYIAIHYQEMDISLLNRMIRTFDPNATAHRGHERLPVWSMAWSQFLESPVWGDRIVENLTYSYPHNILLEVLMSTGLVGFVFFIGTIIYTFISGMRLIKNGFKLIFILFLFLFIGMMFSGSIFSSASFWVIMSLVLLINPHSQSNKFI